MKLQFNLLPDVKQEYLKTQRTKRTVIAASVVAASVALFIFLVMFITVNVINKKQLDDANKNIKKYTSQLKAIPNLDKILTIQNQLNSVVSLHQSKHITSRLYQYLPQVTPSNVCLGQVDLDTTNNILTINGTTDSLKSANVYIDTLKFTKYEQSGQTSSTQAFPSVVESSFGITSNTSTKCDGNLATASFQLTVTFDPTLFTNSSEVTLQVPQDEATTRSVIDDPSNPLFNGQNSKTQDTNNTSGGQ